MARAGAGALRAPSISLADARLWGRHVLPELAGWRLACGDRWVGGGLKRERGSGQMGLGSDFGTEDLERADFLLWAASCRCRS